MNKSMYIYIYKYITYKHVNIIYVKACVYIYIYPQWSLNTFCLDRNNKICKFGSWFHSS